MPNRNRVINKLALVLISLVVLELVLIGDQVQPVKGIKKKIYLKKLKKLLPLFALIKPKKKIILVPIPIPMFKSHQSGHHHLNGQYPHHHNTAGLGFHQASNWNPMQVAPMSFNMLGGDNNSGGERPHHSLPSGGFMMGQLPMDGMPPMGSSMAMTSSNDMESFMTEPTTAFNMMAGGMNGSAAAAESSGMFGPSMTMTIHSKPDGGSNIELSTNINAMGEPSAALMQRPHRGGTKWRPSQSPAKLIQKPKQHQQQPPPQVVQQLQLHLNHDHFEEPSSLQQQQPSDQPGGEQYYSSPWQANRSPLVLNPAKMLRSPVRQQQSWPQQQNRLMMMQPYHQSDNQHATIPGPRFQLPVQQPTQWPSRPAFNALNREPIGRYQQQQPIEQLSQALELEELVPVGGGPPVYPNNNNNIPPPPSMMRPTQSPIEQEQEPSSRPHSNQPDDQDEVQTLAISRPDNNNHESSRTPTNTARPSQQLQQQQHPSSQRPQQQQTKTSGGSSGRLVSPAIKGKQQQQQQLQSSEGGIKQKPLNTGGYYMDSFNMQQQDGYDMMPAMDYSSSSSGGSSGGGYNSGGGGQQYGSQDSHSGGY